MNKRAQVLVVSLWILVALAILAVSIGHRVSLALRLSRYQRDKLAAVCLARSAVALAITELEKDSNDYDALNEPWAKDISGVTDEAGKININTAPPELLAGLLRSCGVDESAANEISSAILAWRGSRPIDEETGLYYKNNLGYPCKSGPFAVVEELILVKGLKDIGPEKLAKLKTLTSVSGSTGKININTAMPEVLGLLGSTAADELNKAPGNKINGNDVSELADAITASRREEGVYFTETELDAESIRQKLGLGDAAGDNRTRMISWLISAQLLTAGSDNFRIESGANAGGVSAKIAAVYDRENKRITFWHEY